jgi:hypothetical protein
MAYWGHLLGRIINVNVPHENIVRVGLKVELGLAIAVRLQVVNHDNCARGALDSLKILKKLASSLERRVSQYDIHFHSMLFKIFPNSIKVKSQMFFFLYILLVVCFHRDLLLRHRTARRSCHENWAEELVSLIKLTQNQMLFKKKCFESKCAPTSLMSSLVKNSCEMNIDDRMLFCLVKSRTSVPILHEPLFCW